MQNKNSKNNGSFYNDDDKITFDQAESIVDTFLDEECSTRSYVKTKHVCNRMNIEPVMHNKVRIHEALEKVCKPLKRSNGTKFKI